MAPSSERVVLFVAPGQVELHAGKTKRVVVRRDVERPDGDVELAVAVTLDVASMWFACEAEASSVKRSTFR